MTRVIEGKIQHCGAIARRLRAGQRTLEAHRHLRMMFASSRECRAWIDDDGELLALGGVTGTLTSSRGTIWLAVSEQATKRRVAFVREAWRQLAAVTVGLNEIDTTVAVDDEVAYYFAKRLGFYLVPPLPLGDSGMLHMEFCRDMQQNPIRRVGAMDVPFIIYTAGRSRTAWLAAFLTYGDHRCHTEVALTFHHLDEIQPFFGSRTGSAETGVAPAWHILEHLVPNIRTVVVRRPTDGIISSFAQMEFARLAVIDKDKLRRIVSYTERCLAKISERPGVLTVDYEDLAKQEICKQVFEHCLPYEFDFEWWQMMSRRNIQSDALGIVRAYQQHADSVIALKREAKRTLLSLARAGAIGSFRELSNA